MSTMKPDRKALSLRERIKGWHGAWRRKDPDMIATAILIAILAVSVGIAYFSMQGIEDYDSPDMPESAPNVPSNARN